MYRKGKDPVYVSKISKLEKVEVQVQMMLRRMAVALKAGKTMTVKALCMTDEIRDTWCSRWKAMGVTTVPAGSFMVTWTLTPKEIGLIAALGLLPKPRGGMTIATKPLPS